MKSRPLLRLFAILLLIVIQLGIALPVLPALALALGGDAVDIGLLYAVQSFGQFATAHWWGALSDRIGRRRVIALAALLVAVAEIATAFAPSLAVLYAARLITGLCAGSVAAASALVADVTDVESRSKGMAVVGISFGIGFTIGPALGAGLGYVAESLSPMFEPTAGGFALVTPSGAGAFAAGLPFLVAGGLGLITAVLAMAVLAEPEKSAAERARARRPRPGLKDVRRLLRNRAIHAMLVLNFLYTVAASVLESTFFVFADGRYGWDEKQVGFVFAGLGILMAIFQGGVGRVAKRVGDRTMVAAGMVLLGVGLIVAPFFHVVPLLLVFLGVATVGRAFVHPGVLSLTSQTGGADDTGRVMGALQSAASLGRIVGPAVGGVLFAYVQPEAPFWMSGVLVLVALVWWLRRFEATPQDA